MFVICQPPSLPLFAQSEKHVPSFQPLAHSLRETPGCTQTIPNLELATASHLQTPSHPVPHLKPKTYNLGLLPFRTGDLAPLFTLK